MFFFGSVVVVLMDKLKFHILFGGNGFYGKHKLKVKCRVSNWIGVMELGHVRCSLMREIE